MRRGQEQRSNRGDREHGASISSRGRSSMHTVVFDIDGTLTESTRLDDACFERAAREVIGVRSISVDWAAYPHSTDDAIAAHLISTSRGRPAARAELDAFAARFMEILDEAIAQHGVRAVPGAERAFALVRGAGWLPAVATGCWRGSALRKLRAAGLDASGLGAAFADDAWPREAIIARAVERAQALEGMARPAPEALAAHAAGASSARAAAVVYVGDGVWDVRACRRSGYRFLGIAQGQRAAALRQEGAGTVLAHYSDEGAFLDAIQRAGVPAAS